MTQPNRTNPKQLGENQPNHRAADKTMHENNVIHANADIVEHLLTHELNTYESQKMNNN
jgi:hypothetical protein